MDVKKAGIICGILILILLPLVIAEEIVVLGRPEGILPNVNRSDFWDALDTPTDITNSEFWYNHTTIDGNQTVYNYTYNIYGSTNVTELCINKTGDTATGEHKFATIGVAMSVLSPSVFSVTGDMYHHGSLRLIDNTPTAWKILGQDALEYMRISTQNGYEMITFYENVTIKDDLTVSDDVNVNGDLDVSGNFTGNNYYGELWNYSANATAWTFTIDSTDIYYNLSALGTGSLNGFTATHDTQANGGSYLTASFDGLYRANMDLSFESTISGGLFGIAIVENGNVNLNRNCYARRQGNKNIAGNVAISCFVRLSTGDNLAIQIENEENTNDVIVHAANLNVVRIGD